MKALAIAILVCIFIIFTVNVVRADGCLGLGWDYCNNRPTAYTAVYLPLISK